MVTDKEPLHTPKTFQHKCVGKAVPVFASCSIQEKWKQRATLSPCTPSTLLSKTTWVLSSLNSRMLHCFRATGNNPPCHLFLLSENPGWLSVLTVIKSPFKATVDKVLPAQLKNRWLYFIIHWSRTRCLLSVSSHLWFLLKYKENLCPFWRQKRNFLKMLLMNNN